MSDRRGRLIISSGQIIGKRYRCIKQLNDGGFANVYKCFDLKKKIPVAIKCYIKSESKSGLTEADMMSMLNKIDKEKKHFIKYYGYFMHNEHVCLVIQEFGMSLFDALRIRKFQPFSTTTVRQIIYKLSMGLQIIHKTGLIHSDLKLENALLPQGFDLNSYNESTLNNTGHQSDPSSDDFMLKQNSNSNFNTGLNINGNIKPSKDIIDEKLEKKTSLDQIDVRIIDFGSFQSTKIWHESIATTRRYRPPEVLMKLRWGLECDIWSLGCILVELATGGIVFDARDDALHLFLIQHTIEPFPEWMCKQCTYDRIRDRFCWSSPLNLMKPDKEWSKELERPPLFDLLKFDPELADLSLKMLKTDPFERISIDEVLNHPFFAECK